MTFTAWVRRYPLRSFLALAFGISWGGVLIVMGSTDFNLIELRLRDTGLIFASMLLGPSVAGLTMTAMLDGRQGLRHLASRVAHYRVGVRWYGVALLTMPLLLLATLWPLSLFVDPAFAPRFQ